MDTVTWILIGVIVLAIIVIYLIKRQKPSDNVTTQVTDERMQDQLGTRHVNASTATSTSHIDQDEDEENRIVQEGQVAQKHQADDDHQAKNTVKVDDTNHQEEAPTPGLARDARDPHAVDQDAVDEAEAGRSTLVVEADEADLDQQAAAVEANRSSVSVADQKDATASKNADSGLKELTYSELKSHNAGQSVSLKGRIASFYTEDLEVPGATALGSLAMEANEIVALKFITPINGDLQSGDTVTLHGTLEGLKDADQAQVPAVTVDSYVKA